MEFASATMRSRSANCGWRCKYSGMCQVGPTQRLVEELAGAYLAVSLGGPSKTERRKIPRRSLYPRQGGAVIFTEFGKVIHQVDEQKLRGQLGWQAGLYAEFKLPAAQFETAMALVIVNNRPVVELGQLASPTFRRAPRPEYDDQQRWTIGPGQRGDKPSQGGGVAENLQVCPFEEVREEGACVQEFSLKNHAI